MTENKRFYLKAALAEMLILSFFLGLSLIIVEGDTSKFLLPILITACVIILLVTFGLAVVQTSKTEPTPSAPQSVLHKPIKLLWLLPLALPVFYLFFYGDMLALYLIPLYVFVLLGILVLVKLAGHHNK